MHNMKDKVIIVGSGGHARSVLDILLENNDFDIVGCTDSQYPNIQRVINMEEIPVIGTDGELETLYDNGIKKIFVAIGDNKLRNKIYDKVVNIGFSPINVISKNAVISPKAQIGQGICIMAGAIVNVNSVIGDNSIINTKASIDHDCVIGKSSHIAPGSTLSGYIKIGDGTHIGTGTTIIDKIKIGSWAFVGGGSVVVSDLNSNMLYYGNPAKMIKKY